jgi:tRNA A-37 threonylcarbamoyl transferase component Bud32/tetratricopeptide (TPR) repeat protein
VRSGVEDSGRARELLAPGELVADRFEIVTVAAVGGMSVVYRARDLATREEVAIKVLNKRDPITDQRFASEAEILSHLSHPAVVRYITQGETRDDGLFIATEWLAGEDLGKRLARRGLRASECRVLMRQLCAGLATVHERGLLHRDIKPSNVFLVDSSIEQVKLLDFGVARSSETTSRLTLEGALIGTVGYMSPEQSRGSLDLDQRTDVFSLGCLLFECLTGQPAFAGAHDLAVLARVLREEPSLITTLRSDLSADFDALLNLLLAKEPSDRPAGAREAWQAIETTYARATFNDDVVAPASRARASFAEQRILSVIAVRPGAESASLDDRDPTSDAHVLGEVAHEFEAEVVKLQRRAWLLMISAGAHSAATDLAAHAARCALRLADRTQLALALATGAADTTSQVPYGVAIDRALGLIDDDSNTIKLDDLTAGLLGARFNVRKTARGLVLESESEGSDRPDVLMGRSTPFVGRVKELAILSANLRECIADEVARAVLVVGPPGAGKSRLGREFIERARVEHIDRILVARADPTTAFSPLSLVRRLIRNAAGLHAGDPIDAQRDALQTYLLGAMRGAADEQLLDFLSEIVGVGVSAPARALHRAARSDPEVMREQKRRAFERWITAVVEHAPLVVFLEDLHWADFPSMNYLQDVIGSLANRPLFVLATSRPERNAHFSRFRERSQFEEINLRGLTKKASEHLARTMLPATTPADVIANVVSRASGNAFYLEELVRRVAEGGSTELPETVVAMAQSRIERLQPEARRILRAASVFGEAAWAGGIDRLLASSADSTPLLESLVEEEILQLHAETRFPGEREYVFRHALLREAAYAMLTDADRMSSHLRAAECLEAWGERDAHVLATHFERGGANERAVPWIAKASMATLESGDFENAIALSRRGAELGASGDQRGQLLLVHAYASTWKSEPESPGEALLLLPRASAPWWLALSLHVYNSTLVGRPELAEPYLQLALTTSPEATPTSAYGQAVQVLAAGAALLGRANIGWALVQHFESVSRDFQTQFDPAFLAWFNLSKCILASNSTFEGRWELGQALSDGHASIDAMRVLGSAMGEAAALFHLGNAYWLAGNFQRSLSLLREALELAKRTGNLLVEEHSTFLLAVAAMRDGSRSEALTTLTNLAESNNRQVSHAAVALLADSSYRDGDLDQALARAREAASGCAAMYRRMARATLARVHLARREFADALAATEQAFADGGSVAFPHLTVDLLGSRAQALLGSGEHQAAARTIAEACSFRDAVAHGIEDGESRTVFRARGRANRVLDQLAGRVMAQSSS